MIINTTSQSSFINDVVNAVRHQLRATLGDLNEQSVAFRVNRLWSTLLTGEDFRATTSSEVNENEPMSDTFNIKVDIVALNYLITVRHSAAINGLDVALRIVLQESMKMVESENILEYLYEYLMARCLNSELFLSSSIKKCEYIRIIVQICQEFEKDLALGLLDLLKNAVQETNGFDRNENRHIDAELNSMIDCSIELPDLCWLYICQYLSIKDIAHLSSTCQTLRRVLWSRQSLSWVYLIRLKFQSSTLCESMRTIFDQHEDADDDEDVIIAENNRFSQRLLFDIEAYEIQYKKFLNGQQSRSWDVYFTLPEKEIRGYFASRRLLFSRSIPLLNCPVPLSSKLFRLYYYRLNKKSIFAPIGAIIFGYLVDSRRCLSAGDMIYNNITMPIDEQRLVKIDNDGGVCITRFYESSMTPVPTNLFFNKIPLWVDLLPGRYNLTCQMRLRRLFVDNCSSDDSLFRYNFMEIRLLGDRVEHGGRWNIISGTWLKKLHQKYGDDRWFNVSLTENFLLNDISNVYFGICVNNNYAILFDVWINTIQLNLIAIS